ncbi:MAG TPA: hypothetical protein EYN66_13130, partial [Myxococcales bacterium]|nr:hypothetical protein [Myxococcales bacterium]
THTHTHTNTQTHTHTHTHTHAPRHVMKTYAKRGCTRRCPRIITTRQNYLRHWSRTSTPSVEEVNAPQVKDWRKERKCSACSNSNGCCGSNRIIRAASA